MLQNRVKIINTSNNPLPEYATSGSSGMDLRAFIPEPLFIEPLQRAMVPTGIFIELPENTEAQVRPRSGLALKQGITCLNSPGTVDSDYRGEIKVILISDPDDVNVKERLKDTGWHDWGSYVNLDYDTTIYALVRKPLIN